MAHHHPLHFIDPVGHLTGVVDAQGDKAPRPGQGDDVPQHPTQIDPFPLDKLADGQGVAQIHGQGQHNLHHQVIQEEEQHHPIDIDALEHLNRLFTP